jgi:hypothetical protein
VRSSRELERRLNEDVAFWVLAPARYRRHKRFRLRMVCSWTDGPRRPGLDRCGRHRSACTVGWLRTPATVAASSRGPGQLAALAGYPGAFVTQIEILDVQVEDLVGAGGRLVQQPPQCPFPQRHGAGQAGTPPMGAARIVSQDVGAVRSREQLSELGVAPCDETVHGFTCEALGLRIVCPDPIFEDRPGLIAGAGDEP